MTEVLVLAVRTAVDRSYAVGDLVLGGIHRPQRTVVTPGGKAFNAAGSARRLGMPVTVVAPLGGPAGRGLPNGCARTASPSTRSRPTTRPGPALASRDLRPLPRDSPRSTSRHDRWPRGRGARWPGALRRRLRSGVAGWWCRDRGRQRRRNWPARSPRPAGVGGRSRWIPRGRHWPRRALRVVPDQRS